jgi:hypothetical protein
MSERAQAVEAVEDDSARAGAAASSKGESECV